MGKREILEAYRSTVLEINTLKRQCDYINRIVGGPSPITGYKLTGMPRGTNDPEAAMIQRNDYDTDIKDMAILRRWREKVLELTAMIEQCEEVLESVEDQRARTILRNYYALGWPDDRIAGVMNYSRPRITQLRLEAIANL